MARSQISIPCSSQSIIRRLTNGSSRSALVPPYKFEGLIAYCRSRVRSQQKRIEAAHRQNRHRIARRELSLLLTHAPARIVAAYEGLKKERRRLRRAGRPIRPITFVEVWYLAKHLTKPQAPSTAIVCRKRKPNGNWRYYCEFPSAFAIAKQKLFVMAISPFASFHPSQYVLRRGRSAACEDLLQAMDGVLPDNTLFFQFDAKDCYASFSRNWLEEFLPTPKAVTRNTLFLVGWRIRVPIRLGNQTMGRRGFFAGSAAASYVAEMVLAEVLRTAAEQVRGFDPLVTYSDNVGGLIPADTDVQRLQESLKHVYQTHPAGPLCLTFEEAKALTKPFRFLGYRFVKDDEAPARVFVPEEKLDPIEIELTNRFADATTLEEALSVCYRLRGYCEALKLAPEVAGMAARVVTLMNAQLEYVRRQNRL
jgi:hypothetical protein